MASQDWPEVTKYAGLVCAQAHRQELIQDLFKTWQDPIRGTVTGGMIKYLSFSLLSFSKSYLICLNMYSICDWRLFWFSGFHLCICPLNTGNCSYLSAGQLARNHNASYFIGISNFLSCLLLVCCLFYYL